MHRCSSAKNKKWGGEESSNRSIQFISRPLHRPTVVVAPCRKFLVLVLTMVNNSSTSSAGGTAVAQQSFSTSQRTLFDSSGEEVSAPLHSSQRFPSTGEMQDLDLLPQLPIRKESGSVHSVSLYDLDPQDSLPRIPARHPSNHMNASSRRRNQNRLRENSSSGSSTVGPPSSVLVPQESEWSGISALMTYDEEGWTTASSHGAAVEWAPPPHLEEEPQNTRDDEPGENLPWDKIAIGVVLVPEKDGSTTNDDQVNRSGMKNPPPASRIEHYPVYSEDLPSEDSVSFPSFHQSSDSHSTQNMTQPVHTGNNNAAAAAGRGPSSQSCIPTNYQHKQPPLHPDIRSPPPSDRQKRPPCPPADAALIQPVRCATNGSVSTNDVPSQSSYSPQNAPTPVLSNTTFVAPVLGRHGSRGFPMSVPYSDFGPEGEVVRSSLSPVTFEQARAWCQRSAPIGPTSTNTSTTDSAPTAIPSRVEGVMIQVAPGVKLPLRGSEETWKAIEEGRVTVTTCLFCNIELQCLDNAQLVACPDCTMLSAVDQAFTSSEDPDSNADGRYGVGVGVKPADVIRWVERQM